MNDFREMIRTINRETRWTFWNLLPTGLMVIVVLMVVVAGLTFAGRTIRSVTETQPTPQEQWLAQQKQRCTSMKSDLEFDPVRKTATCWRTPFMRHPKRVFEEQWREPITP